MRRYVFEAECASAEAPRHFNMGVRWLGPVLMRYGTVAQRAAYLPPILDGTHRWCQGYSEPGAGSDLAALQLRAVRDGDDYVLNGTKIWTTWAQHSTHMFCLVRTSTEGRPQAGISFLLIDLSTPGIEITPIITLSGDHEVNQVFFSDVRVPAANLVGAENQGWEVAKYLLEYERGGDAYSPQLRARMAGLRKLMLSSSDATGAPLLDQPALLARMADFEAQIAALDAMEHRNYSTIAAGGNPGITSSLLKLIGSELVQDVSAMAVEIAGAQSNALQVDAFAPEGQVELIGEEGVATTMPLYFNNLAQSVYSGSNEIQRNIVAKSLLGA
jgi:alkylation response protein AidB-like acyl-CoA dehydrogenase